MTSNSAAPGDVASPQAIVDAVYEILSGRAGEARDWDRWRTLYAPGARLTPIERNGGSSYEAAHNPGGEPIRRGANSIQLWNDGSRWWILSVVWDAISAAEMTDSR